MPVMKNIVFVVLLLLSAMQIQAQDATPDFVAPLGIDLLLSANFGELRSNHFHSGVDFKTQGRTGLKVYAVDEGYVSRIAVSPWGYGKAIYIDHPSGYTTVYAHLDKFVGAIADTIMRMQYERESFAIDTLLPPGMLPVTKGMHIANSGNSGSSGGPHLHFEVRHTDSESPLDPLRWYRKWVKDNVAPEPRLVALYRHNAVENGLVVPKRVMHPEQTKPGSYKCTKPFEAWGRVSLGIKAYDRMNATSNIYGVHKVCCWVDDMLLYESVIDSITFAETRYINSLIDYHELRSNKGSTIMRTAVLPGNKLSTIYGDTMGDGTFVIDQERAYQCRFELTDLYGNRSTVEFVINGRPTDATPAAAEGICFDYQYDNEYATDEMNLYVPAGVLYDNLSFDYKSQPNEQGYSSIHHIHNSNVPLHKWCELALKITCDTLSDEKYYIEYSSNGKTSPVIGHYDAGWYEARVRNMGTYKVVADLVAPNITAINPDKWRANGTIAFKITDKGSGIASYRAEIDGKFCLMEYDAKRSRLSCRTADLPFDKGTYILTLVVSDYCGNTHSVEHTIKI